MADAHDAIPADGTYLLDAFECVFRKQNPDWQTIGKLADEAALALCGCYDSLQREKLQRDADRATIPLDDAHFKANTWLRRHITDGALTAYIRNPVTDKLLQLPRTGWGMVLEKSRIETSFVGPDDVEAPGPDTVIDGARRPVFFKTVELRELILSEIDRNVAPGRPSSMRLVLAELERRILDRTYVLHSSKAAAAQSLVVWLKKMHPEAAKAAPLAWKTIRNEHPDKLEEITRARN